MTLRLFAVCIPGLEPLLHDELGRLGVDDATAQTGGLAFSGTPQTVARVCLESGLANHLRMRLGEPFTARRFDVLQRKAGRLPWAQWLPAHAKVTVQASCRKSRLYHTKAVAERIVGVVANAVGEPRPDGAPVEIHARIVRDQVELSLELSGEALHRRGWRQQTAKAPLREDLARALLQVSGWQPGEALVDPMMGSGTIVIEAATIARNMAPGRNRSFACERMPLGVAGALQRLREHASREVVEGVDAPIVGLDRNPGALRAAHGNAERAGVADDLRLQSAELREGQWPSGPVTVVCNPPWGLRVSPGRPLRALHAALGERVRAHGAAAAAVVVAQPALATATGLPLHPRVTTSHGGQRVTLMATADPQ